MTRDEILDRLDEPRPLRQGEFARMVGYAAYTIREAIKRRKIQAVSLPGTKEPRIPVFEARRILAELRILPDEKAATSATADRKPLRAVGA